MSSKFSFSFFQKNKKNHRLKILGNIQNSKLFLSASKRNNLSYNILNTINIYGIPKATLSKRHLGLVTKNTDILK